MLKPPILFLIFNRPETTGIVFQEIRKQKPTHLFIAADAPRKDKEGELESCEAAKKIATNIDWECDVKLLFREDHLGCRKAVVEAMDWFFTYVDEGIILEDDTLPNEQFFSYCSFMLKEFRDNEKVLSINGCSLGYQNKQFDYGFTRYFNMWGWATWKRSHQKVTDTWESFCNDPDILKDEALLKRLELPIIFGNNRWKNKWQETFLKTANGTFDAWGYRWVYAVLKTDSLCVRPNQNMVKNLGFNKKATHTTDSKSVLANMKYGDQAFNISATTKQGNIDKVYELNFVAKIWNGFVPFWQTILGRAINKFLILTSLRQRPEWEKK